MKTAPLHPKEDERLKALQETNLLDSISEDEFNSVTSLASYICKTPIALISLVDQKRQWFKSKVGLSASETPRDFAFCAHTILQDDVFIVENSLRDERFKDNPLVVNEPKVIFYAGAPILDPATSLPLGTLCVIDNQPRSLDKDQIQALLHLSKQVSKLIELRHQIQKVHEQNKTLEFQNTAVVHMQEGMVIQDAQGQILQYNPAALKILGLSADQLLGRSSLDPSWQAIKTDGSPFPGDEHPAMVAVKTGIPQTSTIMGVRTPDSKERWILINSNPVFLDGSQKPSHSITTFADMTDLRLIQEKLLETAKFVSLAEMASGIAHEINNPLSVIHALSSLASKIAERDPVNIAELKLKLQKIDETVFRISKIVKGLRLLARDGAKEETTDIQLSDVIHDTTSVCAERFRNNQIVLKADFGDSIEVNANYVQLGQVLVNLLNNSFDAIIDQNERWVKIEVESQESSVKIRISDSGTKIPEDIAAKIFMPFYTTKGFGKGTGLGLSISKRLIESMGGQLSYETSHPNTSFLIELQPANKQSRQIAS